MRSFVPRVLLKALLVGFVFTVQSGVGAIAQIPDPLNTGGTQEALDSTVDTIPTIEDTTNNVTNTVDNTVDQTTNTVTDTTNNVTNTVDQTTDTVTDTTNNVTNTVNNTVDQTTNTVTDTTNNVTNTVNNTVTDTTTTVNETTNTVEEVVQSPKPKLPAPKTSPITSPIQQTVGTVTGTVTGTAGGTVNTGTQDAISALGGATGQYQAPSASGTDVVAIAASGPVDAISAIAAAAGGSGTAGLLGSSAGSAGIAPTGRAGMYYSSAGGITPGLLAKRVLGARFLLNWTAILGVSQPSLAILVDAVNDADGDGIYSDAEIAPTPGADVSFKALITNIGAVNFEIANVTNSYNGGTGAAAGTVCGELVGIMLAPGESLACAFPVPDYSPAKGQTLVNSITAAGFEVGKKARRGASDSDTSTVDTILASDEVLAVAVQRNLAFTGTDAARLLAVGLLLLAVGGSFLSLARLRSRKPILPIPSESPVDALGWWAAGPSRTGSRWKVGRR
jgi:hypothetical protein